MEKTLLNDDYTLENLLNNWPNLNQSEREEIFYSLTFEDQIDLFKNLSPDYQQEIFTSLDLNLKKQFIRQLLTMKNTLYYYHISTMQL
jgi:Mg/Co/Ni transporter MgtE